MNRGRRTFSSRVRRPTFFARHLTPGFSRIDFGPPINSAYFATMTPAGSGTVTVVLVSDGVRPWLLCGVTYLWGLNRSSLVRPSPALRSEPVRPHIAAPPTRAAWLSRRGSFSSSSLSRPGRPALE